MEIGRSLSDEKRYMIFLSTLFRSPPGTPFSLVYNSTVSGVDGSPSTIEFDPTPTLSSYDDSFKGDSG